MNWLKKTFWLIVVWFKPKREPAPLPPSPSEPIPEVYSYTPHNGPLTFTPAAPTPVSEPPRQANRSFRRKLSALERARRKHDKFVTPQGEPPAPRPQVEREKTKTKELQPTPEPILIDDAEKFIVGKHHENPAEDVLYKESEFYGEFNFRDTILEQLDRYFVYIARMKRGDPQTYGFYKQVGATLIPYISIGISGEKDKKDTWANIKEIPELPPFFNKHRPAFGCFVYGANPFTEQDEMKETEEWRKRENLKRARIFCPKFMYFLKYSEPPPEVQPMSGGDVYKMTIYWDRPQDPTFKQKGGPEEYAIFVSREGTLKILRMIETKHIDVLVRKKRHDAYGNVDFYHQIPQRAWRIPHHLEDWARRKGTTAEIFLGTIFCESVQLYEMSNYSVVRIAVTKGDTTAVFGVNVHRMAYFFKDRDFVLGEHGGRKPVFHMVRGHERNTKNGVSFVKFHFRGERHFTWAGYEVNITVPGKDHFMLPEIDVGSSDEYWHHDENERWIDPPEFGKKLVNWMKQGVGAK